MQKDQEIETAKLALRGPLQELEQLRKELEATIRDLENYKRRLVCYVTGVFCTFIINC